VGAMDGTHGRALLLAAAAVTVAGSAYMLFGSRKKKPVKYVTAKVMYQDHHVPASVLSSGKVYVDRKTSGADKPPVGEVQREVCVPIRDARGMHLSLDTNGVKLVQHVVDENIVFEDIDCVVKKYYPECCRLVKECTGAKEVFAFDHNLRGSAVQSWMNKTDGTPAGKPLDPQYLSPAAIVHGDYTVTSAPLRLKMLSEAPKSNDSWKEATGGAPLLDAERVEGYLSRRYMFINVWRSVADEPVEDMPLGVCDGMTVPNEDLVTFEVRYVDRTGENYLSKYNPPGGVADDRYHRWLYFPKMTKHEAMLLKTWDSAGAPFQGFQGGGHTGQAGAGLFPRQRSAFCLHTAFKDETAAPDCPKRRSIEVRLVAFF